MKDLIREESKIKRIRRVGLKKGEKLHFEAVKRHLGDSKYEMLIKETKQRIEKLKKVAKPNKK